MIVREEDFWSIEGNKIVKTLQDPLVNAATYLAKGYRSWMKIFAD